MAEQDECTHGLACPIIDRIESLEKQDMSIIKMVDIIEKKIDFNSNFLTKVTGDVEQHRQDSMNRDAETHDRLDRFYVKFANHMDEEENDRKDINKSLKDLTDKVHANAVDDATRKTKQDIMWSVMKHIGTAVGTMLMAYIFYKLGLTPSN